MEESGPEQGEKTVAAVPAGVLEPGDRTAGFSQPTGLVARPPGEEAMAMDGRVPPIPPAGWLHSPGKGSPCVQGSLYLSPFPTQRP